MLKTLRVILALLSITMVTLLFLDFTGTARHLWPWMAEVQLIPAILSANVVAIALVLLLTFVFGRVYCSVICPLGILQDFINRARILVDKLMKKRPRFRYSNAAPACAWACSPSSPCCWCWPWYTCYRLP